MKLSELLHETGIKCPQGMEDTAEKTEITGIALDSRRAKAGDLFVCLSGEHTNGHIYAADALWKGAVAVLAQEELAQTSFPVIRVESTRGVLAKIARAFYEDPAKDMRLFGVTGTNGKTTITYMLQRIFSRGHRDCGIIGTIGYHTGTGRLDREAGRTTPDAFEIWELLSEMKKNGLTDCVMEVSSHGLTLGRVDELRFQFAIFTNLTGDHMDFHKNMEEYYQAKKRLFYMTDGASIINVDDPYGARLAGELRAEGKEVITCSLLDPEADFFGETLLTRAQGSLVSVRNREEGELFRLSLRIPGSFNICNALEAAVAGLSTGVSREEVRQALESFTGAPGRFELVKNSKNVTVIVDYAHTPDALENVLKTARPFTEGRLIAVFGCGGDRDRGKRPVMGEIAGRYSDYCIITSDNPRTEAQEWISEEIEAGMKKTDCPYEIIDGRRQAIERALAMYQLGDVILIAGKGHESYQLIGGTKNYFSDKETVQRVLR